LETLTKVAARGAIDALGVADKAADSDKLDNHDSAYFATADHTHNPPIGFVYIQFQGSGALKSAPGSLFGGTWTELSGSEEGFEFNGEFFRAFKSGVSAVMGTQQADAFQGHIHLQGGGEDATYYGRNGYVDGGAAARLDIDSNSAVGYTRQPKTTGPYTDGSNGTPRTASETRPINYAIRIWERTA